MKLLKMGGAGFIGSRVIAGATDDVIAYEWGRLEADQAANDVPRERKATADVA